MSESNRIYIQMSLDKLTTNLNKIIEDFDSNDRDLKTLEMHAELEALEKMEESQEITSLISIYKNKRRLLWEQRIATSNAIEKLQALLNIEQNVIQENNSYQPTFKEETSNNVYGRRAQYVQPNINNEVLGQASYQENTQSEESIQVEAEQSIQPNINNEVLGQASYQENTQSEESIQVEAEQSIQPNINNEVLGQASYQENMQSGESTQEEEFDDDLFVEDDVTRKYRESVEQKMKQASYQENAQSEESIQVETGQSIQSNINNEVLGQASYQENTQSGESTQLETGQSIQSNINNEELKQASNQKNMQSEKSTQVKQEFKDGLFDDEEKIKASFIGRDGIEIVINRITCKNGIYTISYDRHEKNKTIRGLKKTREIGNKLINKKYLRREFKKKNNSNLLNLLESNNIEFNLSYFLIQEFDKRFGTKIDQSYRNKELFVEYDLGDILTWKSLNKSSAIDLYRIALNQEKNGNANILRHSKMCLMMIKAIDKYKDSKGNNNQRNINEKNNASKRSKNEESSIQDWGQKTKLKNNKAKEESATSNECKTKWDELKSVRAKFSNLDPDNIKYSGNNDFTQEKNSNDKKNNIFTITKIVPIAIVAILAASGIGGIISKKSDSKGSNDPKVEASNIGSAMSNVFTKGSDSKGSNDSKDLAQKDTYNFNPEVKDVLALVYRDSSGNLSREYLLTSEKFGEGEKYASSKCGGDLFKISDITVYNKDTKEIIDIIKNEGLNAQSLYGKYGVDIGVSICLNVCDEEFNVISNDKYYLDYDSYAKLSDGIKQKIYEDNSSKYAKEDEKAKTTESVTTQNVTSETQETKQPEKKPEKTNVQYAASYADSGNNARLLYTDEDGNIIKACKWTSGSDGTGTSGSGKNLDCDSYKFSLVVARNKNEVLKTVVVKKENKSVEQIVAELYETYGNDIQIIYNFDGYQDGKLTDELLGFISKEAYDEFQNITLSEEDKFYGELESTLAKNKAFKGYKLTLNI